MTQEGAIPPDLWERIDQKIDRKVAELARSGMLRNSSISGGNGLTVGGGGKFTAEYPVDLGGGAMLYVGPIVSSVGGAYQGTGLLLQAPDGTDMMVMRTDALAGTTMQNIYDSGGRIIFGNDAVSGQGLARPYIGGVFRHARYADFSVSTTSSTFETLWDAWIPKQHPKLEVAYRASMDTAATTGEVQVLVDSVQLGATTAESFAVSTRYIGPASVAGNHMDWLHVEIQARRTSATGALRVEPSYVYGKQS